MEVHVNQSVKLNDKIYKDIFLFFDVQYSFSFYLNLKISGYFVWVDF